MSINTVIIKPNNNLTKSLLFSSQQPKKYSNKIKLNLNDIFSQNTNKNNTLILDDNQTIILPHNYFSNNLDCITSIIDTKINDNLSNNIETYILQNNLYEIISELDLLSRYIFIKNKLYQGSFNKIYSISKNKNETKDNDILIRILNSNTDNDTVVNEKKGIQIQHKLCSICKNIGIVVDYGKIKTDKINQDYFILAKYGIPLTNLLKSNIKYFNTLTIIDFMYNLLLSIDSIHNQNYAHLDLKPCNIILKNIQRIPKKKIKKIDFTIIDFGSAKQFTNDESIKIDEQMASAAFSPPELLKMHFGKKSDIWSYGVVCYLVCIRKFFIEANASQIFMNTDLNKLKIQIENGITNLDNIFIPNNCNEQEKRLYLYPLNNIDLIKDFFRKIFIIDINKRPNTTQLLKHKLFNHIPLNN